MDVKIDLEREVLAIETLETVHVQITVTPPAMEKPARRKPLNLAVALDRSGSMAGEKLRHALLAIEMLIDQLASDDVFALVTFDHDARVVIPAGVARDKLLLKNSLGRVAAGGGTNLSAGWYQAVTEAKKNMSSERTSRVLLLTDGQANQGVTTPRALSNQAERFVEEGVELSTLGYGADFNEDLLQALALAGHGTSYYIKTPDEAPDVFGRELCGLLTLVAQNLRLRIQVDSQLVTGLRLLNELPVDVRSDSLDISLGSLSSGEQKILVLSLDIAPVWQPGKRKLGEVTIEYDLVVGDVRHAVHRYPLEATHTEGTRAVHEKPVLRVVENVIRMKAVKARRAALERADGGDLQGARQTLQEFRDQHAPMSTQSKTIAETLDQLGREQEMLADPARYKEARKIVSLQAYTASVTLGDPDKKK